MDIHQAYDRLLAAVCKHHSQRGDDRCWLDDLELYRAAGLGPADNTLPPEAEFLANCQRFYRNRCRGGDWPSYQQLEEEVRRLRGLLDSIWKLLEPGRIISECRSGKE